MATVRIVKSLLRQIIKKFKGESHKVLDLISSLESSPKKGKLLGVVGGLLIKELKYRSFRFYFIQESKNLKVLSEDDLRDLLITFVRMSDKNSQQRTINEIKFILKKIGPQGFV